MSAPLDTPPLSLIAAVGATLGAKVVGWHPLHGGRTNRLWQVECSAGAFAVKLYHQAAATPLFPNDPAAEFSVLKSLQGSTLAPEPLALIRGDFGTALIYTFVAGFGWSGSAKLAGLLHAVHQQPTPAGLRMLPSGSDALLAQAKAILGQCKGDVNDVFESLETLGSGSKVPSVEAPGLIHTDPVATNIIETDSGLTLIDWQCPAIGDACEDLGIVLSPFMQRSYLGRLLSAAEQAELLAAYPDKETTRRYRQLAPFFHLRMAAYAKWCIDAGRGATEGDVQAELAAANQTLGA
ncbi:phosphotransferase family protein [Pseudooceanicola sp. MF1-13]|uniref:phosphotransferase family protein n=1 Tax=Pseudooceanicola sp. MF1-13 TaxID=3379095 RepID=UPI0038919C83